MNAKYALSIFNQLAKTAGLLTLSGVCIYNVAQQIVTQREESRHPEIFNNASRCIAKLVEAQGCTVEEQQSLAIRDMLEKRRAEYQRKALVAGVVGLIL